MVVGQGLKKSLQKIARGNARVLGCVQAHCVCSRFGHANPPIKMGWRRPKRFGSTVSIDDYSPVISQRVVLKVPRMYGENCKSRNLLEKQMCVPPSPPITYCKIQHPRADR